MPFEEGKTEADNPYGTEDEAIEVYDEDNEQEGIDVDEEEEEGGHDAHDADDADDANGHRDVDACVESVDVHVTDGQESEPPRISPKSSPTSVKFSEDEESRHEKRTPSPEKTNSIESEPPSKRFVAEQDDPNNEQTGSETKKKTKRKKLKQKDTPPEQSESEITGNVSTPSPSSATKKESQSRRVVKSQPAPPALSYPLYPLKFEIRLGTNTATNSEQAHGGRQNGVFVHEYAQNMIRLVCEQPTDYLNNSGRKRPYECLDGPPPSLGYTVDTEPEKLKYMRLNLRDRFASAMDHGITVIEFAARLLRLWGGSLVGVQSAKEIEGRKRAEADVLAAAQAAEKAVAKQTADTQQTIIKDEGAKQDSEVATTTQVDG